MVFSVPSLLQGAAFIGDTKRYPSWTTPNCQDIYKLPILIFIRDTILPRKVHNSCTPEAYCWYM